MPDSDPAPTKSSGSNRASTKSPESLQELVSHTPRITLPVVSTPPATISFVGLYNASAAQRFIESAVATCEDALTAGVRLNRLGKLADGKGVTGQWRASEQDLLRAALTFAGAGLDAALKQLVKDGIAHAIEQSTEATRAFEKFAESHLAARPESENHKTLVRIFMSTSPRDYLLEVYRSDLTSGSLQSANKVREVAVALGLTDMKFMKRCADGGLLDKAFKARNEIVHELDLLHPFDPPADGGALKARRPRTMKQMHGYASEIMSCAQEIVNHVMSLPSS